MPADAPPVPARAVPPRCRCPPTPAGARSHYTWMARESNTTTAVTVALVMQITVSALFNLMLALEDPFNGDRNGVHLDAACIFSAPQGSLL